VNEIKKICIISSVHRWNDTRIFYKEASSLAKKYNVELHAIANFKYKNKNNVSIYGLSKYNSRVLRPLNWMKLFYRTLKSSSEVVHFHDPELIIIGLILKFFTNKKIIYDIHEDYSKTILDKEWLGYKWIRKVISIIFKKFEMLSSKLFEGNIVVLDQWEDKYQNSVSVKNFPIIFKNELDKNRKKNKVVYIGNLCKERGIIEMLKSFELVLQKSNNISFDIIGTWANDQIKEEALQIVSANKNINYLGFLPIDKAKKIIKQAKFGLCLYTSEKYEENLPVKMYEYLSLGTPVLCTNFKSWKRLIETEGWGLSVNPFNYQEVSQIILKILNKSFFNNLYSNCLKYRNKYNWNNEEKKLLDFYKKIQIN